jgi:predicted dehydrogenase
VNAGPAILVLGVGSIGSRHARNFSALGANVSLYDPDHDRASRAGVDIQCAVVVDPDPTSYEGVVVASPTSMHAEQLRWALQSSGKVLVEKPLVRSSIEVDRTLRDGLARTMVGYNLRFRRGYAIVRDLVALRRYGDVLGGRIWFGSHLPEWRPSVDYRQSYSARRSHGGGVLRDAIHELDLLLWILGWPITVVGGWVGRVGPLELDVEDSVRAVLLTVRGAPLSLELDYLSRRYRRGIELVCTDATIRYDWATAAVEIEDRTMVNRVPCPEPVDQTYVDEARQFLAFIDGRSTGDAATGAEALLSVTLLEEIEDLCVR